MFAMQLLHLLVHSLFMDQFGRHIIFLVSLEVGWSETANRQVSKAAIQSSQFTSAGDALEQWKAS